MVIAIIGVLLSISIPAFEKITKGNRVNSAAASIGTALSLARSQAIAQRRYVAVIMPVDSADEVTDAMVKAELKTNQYIGFRLCYLTYNDPDYFFAGWLPGSKWQTLPDGTVIFEVDDQSTAGTLDTTVNGDYPLLYPKIKGVKKGVNVAELDYGAIIFTPFGGMINNDLYIKVTDGVFTSKLVANKTLVSKDPSTGKPLNYMAIKVSKFTGRASYE